MKKITQSQNEMYSVHVCTAWMYVGWFQGPLYILYAHRPIRKTPLANSKWLLHSGSVMLVEMLTIAWP